MSRSRAPPPGREKSDVLLRVLNLTDPPLSCVWVDYEGNERHYATIHPRSSYTQATYCSHPWRIKDQQTTVTEYCGDTASIIINVDGRVSQRPGLINATAELGIVPRQVDPKWGTYKQRGSVRGIPICAYECVSQEAVQIAIETIEHMLAYTPIAAVQQMITLGAELAIIGSNQVTTDIPAHAHLKGQRCEDGRNYDTHTRGLGGTVAFPVTSVGEENLLMVGDTKYCSESILVHEFAHAVMNLGLYGTAQLDAIHAAFKAAKEKGIYDPTSYIASNADEYWAEASQAWFHATVRTDVTSGMTTRKEVKERDPELAAIMEQVWGDGSWRYLQTAPKNKFKGGSGVAAAWRGGGSSNRGGFWRRIAMMCSVQPDD